MVFNFLAHFVWSFTRAIIRFSIFRKRFLIVTGIFFVHTEAKDSTVVFSVKCTGAELRPGAYVFSVSR